MGSKGHDDVVRRIKDFRRGRRLVGDDFPGRAEVLRLYTGIAFGPVLPEDRPAQQGISGKRDAGLERILPDAPSATKIRRAGQERVANEIGRAMHEKWSEDPFAFLEHDLDSAKIIPDYEGVPLSALGLAAPTRESLLDTVLHPLLVRRRAAVRKRGPDRSALRDAEKLGARWHITGPIRRRIQAHDAKIAAIDAEIEQRRAEILPIVEAALRGEGGWRVVNGYAVDAKGRRLLCDRRPWHRLSEIGK